MKLKWALNTLITNKKKFKTSLTKEQLKKRYKHIICPGQLSENIKTENLYTIWTAVIILVDMYNSQVKFNAVWNSNVYDAQLFDCFIGTPDHLVMTLLQYLQQNEFDMETRLKEWQPKSTNRLIRFE